MNIAEQYSRGLINGWDEQLAADEFRLFGKGIPRYYEYTPVDEPTGKRRMLWEYTRKVINRDVENIAQLIGDCVSWGGRNAIEYLSCVEIALNGDRERYRPIFAPFFYGTSRVQIGGGRLGNGDGSLGTWLEQAIRRHGSLAADENGVPTYSGSVAKQWGRSGPPRQFLDIAKPFTVKETALITSSRDCADALWKGYPTAVCSNQGFQMRTSSDGFHQPSGSWAHCMTIIGFEDHPQHGLYFIILNSWGDAHGRLRDFETGLELPIGILRVKANIVDRMLRQNDSFAYSLFNGFPDNSERLNKADFKIFGA